MKTSVVALSLGSVLLVGCIDFGDDIARAQDTDARVEDGAAVNAVTAASSDASSTGCVEGEVPPSDVGPQIRLLSFSVDRPLVEIARGDVVTWTNADSMEHTATAGDPGAELPQSSGGFGSPLMVAGDRWAFRFCDAREIVWFCRIHPLQQRDYRIVIR